MTNDFIPFFGRMINRKWINRFERIFCFIWIVSVLKHTHISEIFNTNSLKIIFLLFIQFGFEEIK